MKTKIAIALFLAFLFCGFESVWCQAKPAPVKKAAPVKHLTVTAPRKFTIKTFLAGFPATAIKVIAVPTDALEYVSGKVYAVAQKIDNAADAAEVYLSNVQ